MPWKSDKQRRWGNSPAGHKALGDAGVAEWNAASKGMSLPESSGHKADWDKGKIGYHEMRAKDRKARGK